ncbi:MAG: helix-turn-helix domain-containing protein [Chitinivibrionales bacterium]|nr:helix-turn-helix domain-containing protein [Chitinivibrionales bacterium]
MSAIGQTIRRLREERGWTQAQLGERVGINGTNIARRETGQTRVRANERFAFAKAFGMTVIEFDEQWREWSVPRTRGAPGIPVINRAPAGEVIDYEEYGVDSGQGFEYVDRGDIQDDLAFAVIVVGESMEPRLKDGDYVILSPCDPYKGDGKLQPGNIVFVRFSEDAGGGCTLARFFVEDEGQIRLQKDNPAYAPVVCEREAVQRIAVAVERREKL